MHIVHHGAVHGLMGACHELQIGSDNSVLIDCGLLQANFCLFVWLWFLQ